MVDVLMHPLSGGISSPGFTHQPYLYCAKAVDLRALYRDCASLNNVKSLHVVCIAHGCYACFSINQSRPQRMHLGFRNLNCKIAGVDYDLAHEGQDFLTSQEREQFDGTSLQQNVHSQGRLIGRKDLDMRDVRDYERVSMENVNMVENRLVYLEERDEETLSRRILKLSRSNKVRSALELYKSMDFLRLKPNSHACNSVVSCLLRNGMIDDALKIFDSMKATKMATGHTCSLILKAVADAWGCDAALSMFEEMERNKNVNRSFDAVVYNTMISVFSKANNWVQTDNIWRKLRHGGHSGTIITYRLLVCTFVRCGQSELALDAYHEMVQNGLTPGEDEMQAVIGACMKEGKWDLALTVFQNMLKDGLKPSANTCNALINSLGKAGKVNLAFKVYDMMKSLGHVPDAYTWNALLGALNKVKKYGDAIQLFESIRRGQNSVLSLRVYLTVLMSYQKLGMWERALQLLWQMEAAELRLTSAPYNLVIGACEVARQPKVALQIYDHMVHQNCPPDIFTLLSLIRCCIWGSLWHEVEHILNRNLPNGHLYNAAVQGLFLSGNIDLAFKLYDKMKELDLNTDSKTRALVLQKLPKYKSR